MKTEVGKTYPVEVTEIKEYMILIEADSAGEAQNKVWHKFQDMNADARNKHLAGLSEIRIQTKEVFE